VVAAPAAPAAVEVEAGDAEANGGVEAADFTGDVEEEQPRLELEDSYDESVGHGQQVSEEHDHQGTPPEAPTKESDAGLVQSQSLTEDHPVPSGQVTPPGEEDADQAVSEPEDEASLEHEPAPDSASSGMEPEARLDEVKPRHPANGNDLEDVVNTLQGDLSFPSSTHLEVAGEIPDED